MYIVDVFRINGQRDDGLLKGRGGLTSIKSGDMHNAGTSGFALGQTHDGEVPLSGLTDIGVDVFMGSRELTSVQERAKMSFLRARMRFVASGVPSWKLPNQRSKGISSDP